MNSLQSVLSVLVVSAAVLPGAGCGSSDEPANVENDPQPWQQEERTTPEQRRVVPSGHGYGGHGGDGGHSGSGDYGGSGDHGGYGGSGDHGGHGGYGGYGYGGHGGHGGYGGYGGYGYGGYGGYGYGGYGGGHGGCAGIPDGLYCGNHVFGGDPGTLYECRQGAQLVVQVCPGLCVWSPPGVPDHCG